MVEYHHNLLKTKLPASRRRDPEAALSDFERRQLRAVLGSLQWLVAQLRFDMAFTVSSLQSAEPTVRTLLRANAAVRVVRQDSNFELTFRPIDYRTAGLMVVTDASLGSVKLNGSCEGTPAGLLLCGLGGQGFDEWRGRKVQHLGCSLPPHPVVVDAKDVHDKGNSDTSSYGTQKSLAFTVAWLCPSEAVDVPEMDGD